MAYFADLSKYAYHTFPRRDDLVNVGWLDLDQPFATGTVDQRIVRRIGELCKVPVNQTRGFHACSMCSECPVREVIGNESVALGSAEIHVSGKGKTYSCPTLIYHYIVKHEYLPPQEFLDAVSQMYAT